MHRNPDNNRDGAGSPPASTILAAQSALVAQLFAESHASEWNLTLPQFRSALERSAGKRFPTAAPSPPQLEEFLGALHLQDFALATACSHALPAAWDHFVAAYRNYLRAAAAAVLRRSSSSPEACDLADSLFADLYGLRDGDRSSSSLFRYFHGRSSLKTWLRAVLAQRHIDAIRASRRFTELNADADSDSPAPHHSAASPSQSSQPALDPHRQRYLSLFTRALEACLAQLPPRDRERLRLYYAADHTLAEIGCHLSEHESSVSRNLDRTRRDLRQNVEAVLRAGHPATDGLSAQPGLSDAEISLCLDYATEVASTDATFDFEKLFPGRNPQTPPAERQEP
ncbi:MAG TPA: sigma-70 family RNA polymerase sigma factor [Candidatus Acidoferrum sp.]